ncbi:uncharacterized protein V1516DRAFT_667309 [Lipomyces oligophaga]|uniref:uncharacterized protein n=1 Tax=Lipomyces oligophaga TaxID=45792 RepID=UPI0034D01FFB
MSLPSFLSEIRRNLNDPISISILFSLDLTSRDLASLQNDLVDKGYDIESLVEQQNYFDGDWYGFTEFVKTYLRFVKEVDPYDLSESYHLFERVLNDLQVAYSNSRAHLLSEAVRKIAPSVTAISIDLDLNDRPDGSKMDRTLDVSKILLKMFNSIRAERSTPMSSTPSKKIIILFIAVLLCKCYFKVNQPMACANVFSNIHTAHIKFSDYPRAQRVTFRYYLGRFYFLRQSLTRARFHLQWAFDNCHALATSNLRAILTYLIPTNLLLGVGTTMMLYSIAGPTLEAIFRPLDKALRTGDLFKYNSQLVQYFEWFKRRKMYVLLKSKGEILVFRNLLRTVHRVTSQIVDTQMKLTGSKGHPTDVTYENMLLGIALSTRTLGNMVHSDIATDHPAVMPYVSGELAWDYDDVENVCISLCNQGFMMGNIFTRSKLVRLRKAGGFRSMKEIRELHESAAKSGYAEEAWMNT